MSFRTRAMRWLATRNPETGDVSFWIVLLSGFGGVLFVLRLLDVELSAWRVGGVAFAAFLIAFFGGLDWPSIVSWLVGPYLRRHFIDLSARFRETNRRSK